MIQACESSLLTGRSGNGYSTADKLRELAKCSEKVQILLVNGVECDPGLVHDAWLYRNQFNKIKVGIKLLQKFYNFKKSYLATREPIVHNTSEFEQVRVPNRFPCGYEKELIKFVLDVDLAEKEYPINRGILVINIQTVIALAELLQENDLTNNKYLTVANLMTSEAVVVKVPLGMIGRKVVQAAFSGPINNKLYIGGGALNCHEMVKDEVIDQTTNFIGIGDMPNYEAAGRCKGCGACSRNCPKGIAVHKIVRTMEKENKPAVSTMGADRCIGCGACTYGCLAGKDVRAVIAQVKNKGGR